MGPSVFSFPFFCDRTIQRAQRTIGFLSALDSTPRNQTATAEITMEPNSMSGCGHGLTPNPCMQACILGDTRTKHKQGKGHRPINSSGAPVPAAAGGLLSLPRRVAAYLTRALHLRGTQVGPASSTCWTVGPVHIILQVKNTLHPQGDSGLDS